MYPYLDMHCDTLLKGLRGGNLFEDASAMLDIKRMKEANQGGQFFAVFFPPRPGKEVPEGSRAAMPPDDELFASARENLLHTVETHSDIIAMAYNGADLKKNRKEGKMSAFLTVEDGRNVLGDFDRLQAFYDQGVRAIALTWNFENCFGAPNSKDPGIMSKGLTPFGKEAIGVMNDLGILIDVSHLSDGGFWDVVKGTKKPFVATHSNCRALCGHTRNLTDEMIRALAEKGGVSGINFGPDFLAENNTEKICRVDDLCAHILHFIQVGGEDCVGLGTDFDGIGGTFEVGMPTEMEKLFAGLKKKGLTESQIEKVAYQNVERVIDESMK